jgi:FkbM family methyltransferase
MLKAMRETIKRAPIVGPALYGLYMKARYNEGETLEIQDGALSGKKWVRFMRTHNDAYVRGDYEPTVQSAITKFLHPGMTFYDVGANAGFLTLLGAARVGPKGSVVSFEPHPETAAELRRQISANHLTNVEVIEAAICDRVGTAEFSDDTVAVMASLTSSASGHRTIKVKTETLDSIVANRALPDLLKIDIEGAEIDALRGASKLISQKRPVLLVELHSPEIAAQYDSLMKEFGYKTSAADGGEISAGDSGERFVVSEFAR